MARWWLFFFLIGILVAVVAAYGIGAGVLPARLLHRTKERPRLGARQNGPRALFRLARNWGPLVVSLVVFLTMLAFTLHVG